MDKNVSIFLLYKILGIKEQNIITTEKSPTSVTPIDEKKNSAAFA